MFRAGGRFFTHILLIESLFLLCFCGGCAQRPPFDLGLGPVRGPEDIVERVNENAGRLRSLRAEARIRWPQLSHSRLAKVSLLYAQPSRYKVKFSALFGTTIAVMSVRQGEVDIYLPQANRLYHGQPSPETMDQVLGIEMSLEDLMATLVGNVRLPPASRLLAFQPAKEGYALSFQMPAGRQEVLVAADGLRVLSVELFDVHDRPLLLKTFQDHRLVDGVVRPGQVELFLSNRGEELRLVFTHQEVNQPIRDRAFHLDLPASVQLVPLYPE